MAVRSYNPAMVLLQPNPYVICPHCRRLTFLDCKSSPCLLGKPFERELVECSGCQQTQTYGPEDVLPVIPPRDVNERWSYGKHSNHYSVYLIMNTRNGMIYIGMTTQCLSDRKSLHESSCRRLMAKSTAIQRAMAEFVTNAFNMILLEEAIFSPFKDQERYYISRLDACNPTKGYNRKHCRTLEEIEAYRNSFANFTNGTRNEV
jgi:hypothetical protein